MQYKKRRHPKGPNKNEERHRRGQTSEAPLGVNFPSVERLVLDLSFFDSRGNFLDKDTRDIHANEGVSLSVPCPGNCGTGAFNLKDKLDSIVQQRLPSSEGRAKCEEVLFEAGPTCGCEVRAQINLEYRA